MPSINVEDYLKHVYYLQEEGDTVTTSSLAGQLNIAAASVTDMVKKLSEQHYLRHSPYRGVQLTEKGRRSALKIIRKHRLWEMFLSEVLHFGWDEIDEEAEKFEHIMSDRMEERIDEVLGFPRVDPHGDPIPAKNGTVKNIRAFPLSDAPEGNSVRVLRVNDANPELLQYVSSIGLSLNKRLSVKQRIKFDKSLIIKIGSKEIAISTVVAENIFVEAV
jgi:DtxR family Mn-dependent transcriptional regulator